jgi:flavin-dependent dehydrogenase
MSSGNYHCAIVGGGVAGLCLAIQLARQGRSVILFEKNRYPFHKVCGEYVSNESRDFLTRLGLPLTEWDLPQITELGISSEKGYLLNAPLGLGGIGISRHRLDHELYKLAVEAGVTVHEGTKVVNVTGNTVHTGRGTFSAAVVAGAFGKSEPVFAKEGAKKIPNYIGVKYHIKTDLPARRIELHNFRKGYCGVSKIEDDRYCLCYLSDAQNLKESRNSIAEMEERFVKSNPFLKRIFENAEFIFKEPVTISNIRFQARKTSDSRMLYLGDAAGCTSPLTGNGMSMAAHASFILCGLVNEYLDGAITLQQLQWQYASQWHKQFAGRIKRGRYLQYLFGKRKVSDLVLRMLDPLTPLKTAVIAATHGQPY